MDLTEEELARARRAYIGGKLTDHHEPSNRRAVRTDRDRLLKIQKLWQELDHITRIHVQEEIAARCGGDPSEVDVGFAAGYIATEPKGEGQRPKKVPGLRAVVQVLLGCWAARRRPGEAVELGQLRQVRQDGALTPYPSLLFVAEGVLAVMPEVYARTRDPEQRRRRLLVEVDTQLRDIVAKGGA